MGNSKRYVYKRGVLIPIQRGVNSHSKIMSTSPN